MKQFIYKVVDDVGNVLFEGTSNEFCTKFNYHKQLSYYDTTGYRLMGKYNVIKVGECEVKRNYNFKKNVIKYNREDEVLKDMIINLERYGNTITKSPDKYVKKIKEYGIKVSVIEKKDEYGKYYILERKY